MISKLLGFWVTLFFLVIFMDTSYSLKKGDVGTCLGKVSSIGTRKVPYIATGYCRSKKYPYSRYVCRGRKTKQSTYLTWKTGTICCEGWQHNDELDACKPICSTGCVNGTCVAPETCQCDPPTYLHPARRNVCLTPACDTSCLNPICLKNNQDHTTTQQTTPPYSENELCECLNKTQRRFNETYCVFCAANHTINPDFTCSPECSTPCVNGKCTAPNKCECLEGYKYRDSFTCEPQCSQCDNGRCVGPNTCECLVGFSAVNETHCVPCKCDNGDCVSGKCVCRDGYRLVDGICEPICDSCVNGACTAPGECTCFEEHAKSKTPGICCRPECGGICDDHGECPSVACVPRKKVTIPNCTLQPRKRCIKYIYVPQLICCKYWKYNATEDKCEPICKSDCVNGHCVAPDTCSCLTGFVEHNETMCVSHCDMPCNKGLCSAPNVCTCDPHHILDPKDKFNCLPICDTPCVNASCDSPNTCKCNPGYEPENSWQCKPVCDSCQNGQCVAPNNCSCNDGYTMKLGQCTPVCDHPCLNGRCTKPNVCSCDDGYRFNPSNNTCEPVCEQECINSKCTSPNQCSCHEGYEKEDDWKCKPVCENCESGICIAPNTCSCDKGYELKNGSCSPVCDSPCYNGLCSLPNVCSCNAGYKLKNNFTCEPICEPECENGRCVSPNTCFCDAGYEIQNTWKCRPICENCDHGKCTAPNVCSCDYGYSMESGHCNPVCEIPCKHGKCVSPNKCECYEGYKLDEITLTCEPVCDPSCIKSECVAPNKCRCLEGYEETSKSFVCKPSCEFCDNGVCVAPGRCNCNEGYRMLNGKCFPICPKGCMNGNCSSPNTCTCFPGFVKREQENICYKTCDDPCNNGYCNKDGKCDCHPGFEMHNDTTCYPIEPVDCDSCDYNCTADELCRCNNDVPCYKRDSPSSEEITTSPSLAGLQWGWMLGGAVGLLLITLLLVVIQRTWAQRTKNSGKPTDQNLDMYNAVEYHTVIPNTLIGSRAAAPDDQYDKVPPEPDCEAQDTLLGGTDIADERL